MHTLNVHFPWLQAPEVFIGNYGLEADIWAAGMMMYQLLVRCSSACDADPFAGCCCTPPLPTAAAWTGLLVVDSFALVSLRGRNLLIASWPKRTSPDTCLGRKSAGRPLSLVEHHGGVAHHHPGGGACFAAGSMARCPSRQSASVALGLARNSTLSDLQCCDGLPPVTSCG